MTDQFAQLAAQQVAAPQQPVVNSQEMQPVQNAQPINQEPQANQQAIPYQRFQEVVAQKNQALADAQAAMQYAQQLQQQQPQASQPGINSVDDLMKAVKQEVGAMVQPLQNTINEQRFVGNVDQYFASNPDKAALRQDMANFAATFPPTEQQMMKEAITNGNARWLDMLANYVATNRQGQAQQAVQQAQQQQINQATSPTSFRSYRPVQATFGDKLQTMRSTPEFSEQRSQAAQDIFRDIYRTST